MAKQKAPELEISGVTADGSKVVKGIFRYHADLGIPLTDLLDSLKAGKLIVDWPDFVAGAKQDGWGFRTIISKIVTACTEVYDKDYAAEIEKRLRAKHA